MQAMQDGTVTTAWYRATILKEEIPPVCAACGNENEMVVHILTRCERNLFSLTKQRRDEVVRVIARAFFCNTQTSVSKNLRQGMVFRLAESATLIVDWPILTIENVTENKPDLVVIEEWQIPILEVTIVWEPKVLTREKGKFTKYQDLAADLARHYVWKIPVRVVPIVVGVLGCECQARKTLQRWSDGNKQHNRGDAKNSGCWEKGKFAKY